MKHRQSKFVIRMSDMTVIEGRLPKLPNSLWKGETETGDKVECAGGNQFGPTFYNGWSS